MGKPAVQLSPGRLNHGALQTLTCVDVGARKATTLLVLHSLSLLGKSYLLKKKCQEPRSITRDTIISGNETGS